MYVFESLFMNTIDFFLNPSSIAQKQYEALRLYFVDKIPVADVAKKFGYTYRGFTTIISQFRKDLKEKNPSEIFFSEKKKGRKRPDNIENANMIIISLRKANHSVDEIKTILDSKGFKICEKTIYNILREEGFPRLPRRKKEIKANLTCPKIQAEPSVSLDYQQPEEFKSNSAGILCLLPYIEKFGIREIIEASNYPGTKQISKQSSI